MHYIIYIVLYCVILIISYHIYYINTTFQDASQPSNMIASMKPSLSLPPKSAQLYRDSHCCPHFVPLLPSIHLGGIAEAICLMNVSAEAVPQHYGESGINENRKCNEAI